MSEPRKSWLSLLAKAPADALNRRWRVLGLSPSYEVLRPAEIGSVLVRGRQGAVGAPFNLGEVTVSRCSIRLDSGEIGHGYVQGRDKARAELVAVIDAVLQTDQEAEIRAGVLDPLAADAAQARKARAAKAEATRVDFFTMVRGEN